MNKILPEEYDQFGGYRRRSNMSTRILLPKHLHTDTDIITNSILRV